MSDLHLIDTHVLVWAVAEPHRLNATTRSLIEANRYAVSVVTLWELINKKNKPGAPVKNPAIWWEQYVVRPRTRVVSVLSAHILQMDRLPWLHKDPFDRMLIAQSVVERMPLITGDNEIQKYEIDLSPA